jgi:alpha-glucosidase
MPARPMGQPESCRKAASWWMSCVGYEIYLPSFADGNGDGLGDLIGVDERLEYLAWLGIGAVWLTPFYPSPMRDGGYDVANYQDVDRRFGTLAHFDRMLSRAHDHGLRVIVDLVPNHTSVAHPWFLAARTCREDARRDWYLWRDPKPGGGPPNNWQSHFGGPAWSFDPATGQYWLHLFSPDQADLNWRNPAVVSEFDAIMRFWLDRGVDGFRIDVAHGLVKHHDLLDNPSPGLRLHELDQDEVLDLHRHWRTIVEPYGAILLGEVALKNPQRVARYVGDGQGLHLAFWFGLIDLGWDPAAIKTAIVEPERLSRGHFAWFQSSHDRSRPVSRYDDLRCGSRRALLVTMLLTGLPGMPFLYMGEELGLADVAVPTEHVRDAKALRTGDYSITRDRSRTPMPWRPVAGLGFTTSSAPWLPVSGRSADDTVEVQRADASSHLRTYRRLNRLRSERPDFQGVEPVEWLPESADVIGYRRGSTVVVVNCSESQVSVPLPPGRWSTIFAATGRSAGSYAGNVRVGRYEGLILGAVS